MVLLVAVALLTPAGLDARSSSVPVFTGCTGKTHVRPRAIVIACGDGNFFLTGLSWTRWTAHGAAANGTGHLNDCTPDCARGHFHRYRVAVRLFRPITCASKQRRFTRLSYRFVGRKPPGVVPSGTERFPCDFPPPPA